MKNITDDVTGLSSNEIRPVVQNMQVATQNGINECVHDISSTPETITIKHSSQKSFAIDKEGTLLFVH
jgi:hypothetical protein